jgi:hypothetical protein
MENSKKSLYFLFTLILIPTFLGGCFVTDFIGQKVSEKVGEELIEKGTGAKDIDVDEDGVKIETDEGTWAYGEGTKLPKDFPDDIPLYTSGTLTSAYDSSTSTGKQFTAVFSVTGASVETISNYFLTKFEEKGWEKTSEYNTTNYMTYSFKKGEDVATSTIISSEEGKDITVSITADIKN